MTDFSPSVKASWGEWLEDFKQEMYPVFKEEGVSLTAGLLAFQLNRLDNELQALRSALEYQNKMLGHRRPDDDDDEPWRGDIHKRNPPS